MVLRTQPSPAAHSGTRAALTDLVSAVRQLEGLVRQVGPFALPSGTCDRKPEVVEAVCRELGIPLTFDGSHDDHALLTLAAGIQQAQRAPALAGLSPEEVAREARLIRDEEDAGLRVHCLERPDGAELRVVEAGPETAPCILLSSACGMSHRLTLPWLKSLGDSYRCVVLETRGTGEPVTDPADFDRYRSGVPEQAGDLLAVAEALDTGPCHLMGLCGGAVPALLAAAQRPSLVRSTSLWHADLELGPEAAKTDHQTNLRSLLDLAGESRDTAGWLRDKLASGPMTGVPPHVGPLVVRPYATTELFYRYARLTGATMRWDSRATAAKVTQPTLIVTSEDDHTAHPDGSRRLAQLVPDTRLVVTEHGTHLDAFRASPDQVGTLVSFLEEVA
ncbi:alpha/beta hydrolase [Streptomyces sp. NPDC093982]|jgi:pimeloyl-ACP methyl ester carboxylesterase|uniref:alpha/beta fold hydrolase n=1 Tax=Streptomyces sp. NPDC093982 TaxID=3155077 RepID=UPI0034441A4C